jgi:hypothetical protein
MVESTTVAMAVSMMVDEDIYQKRELLFYQCG